ncbi:hypothetical protein O181_115509 [Austropuccinia psidii MF-1]|uniref:CCHC-type domain-containing protein n=1 Tax=Austropuccinia psidii MF-1 TaxID=1389203 RepID=A0A9Q3PVN8_9BASI|nr:hypothetical protein [Austropuccinia psidii MF-1]
MLRRPLYPESLENRNEIEKRNNELLDMDVIRKSGVLDSLKDLNILILRKRTNIGKFSLYRSSSFKEKQHLKVEFKDKLRERVGEVEKKKNSCHNCGSTNHYSNNCPRAKKKVYAIEKVPEEESPTEDL